jgi:hypothetical protein
MFSGKLYNKIFLKIMPFLLRKSQDNRIIRKAKNNKRIAILLNRLRKRNRKKMKFRIKLGVSLQNQQLLQ